MRNRMITAGVVALMALLLLFQPTLAAASIPTLQQEGQQVGLSCAEGVCRAQLDLGVGSEWLPQGAWLTVLQGALRQLPEGVGFAVEDDITITLPTGKLELLDADVVMTLDKAGRIATLRGSAAAPVPTFGLLGDWQVVTPARVSVGYDLGAALTELNAPLQPERRYFFVDAQAGLHLAAQGVALEAPAGQHATLVMDFAQPLLFMDGQVTLRTDGQMAFIREALGPVGESDWFPTDLPLRQRVNFHLQGQLGRDVEPKLTLSSEVRMEGGLVGNWLQIDATPLLAQGQAVIGPDGLLLAGAARSAVEPGQWFDGGAQAQLYIPFAEPESAAVTMGADVASLMLGVEHVTTATLAGEPGWMARTSQAAWQGVQQGWDQVGTAAQSGYGWMSNGISTGLSTGWSYTQQQWCGLTNTCGEEGVRVATAE